MNAPARLDSEAFDRAIADHVATRYRLKDGQYRCRKCNSVIQQTTGYISVHSKLFSNCAGGGSVKHVPLPYCPQCEGAPTEIHGCVHV